MRYPRRNLHPSPHRPLRCPSIELRTATNATADEDDDQDYDEERQRPTTITITITTRMVHRQQVVDRDPLSAYALALSDDVGRCRRLVAGLLLLVLLLILLSFSE